MVKTCAKCKRQFNPEMEFVEDYDLITAMAHFIDVDNLCPECIYQIEDSINNTIYEIMPD